MTAAVTTAAPKRERPRFLKQRLRNLELLLLIGACLIDASAILLVQLGALGAIVLVAVRLRSRPGAGSGEGSGGDSAQK